MTARVAEVLAFEPVAPAAPASRRAVVRWNDGTVGEALRWYDDEILICEGDIVGKTTEELRALLFQRDRDYLTAEDD